MSVDGVPAAETSLQPTDDAAAEANAGPVDHVEQAATHGMTAIGGAGPVSTNPSGPRNTRILHLGESGTGNEPASTAHFGPVLVSRRQPSLHRLVAAVSAPALSLSDEDGQIRARGAQGLYVADVRVMSELVVTVDGEEPVPIGHDLMGGSCNGFEAAVFNVGRETPDPAVFLSRHREVHASGMVEEMTLSSGPRSRSVAECRSVWRAISPRWSPSSPGCGRGRAGHTERATA